MLTVEHLAAEALRYERLRANTAARRPQQSLRWLFEIFGLGAPQRS